MDADRLTGEEIRDRVGRDTIDVQTPPSPPDPTFRVESKDPNVLEAELFTYDHYNWGRTHALLLEPVAAGTADVVVETDRYGTLTRTYDVHNPAAVELELISPTPPTPIQTSLPVVFDYRVLDASGTEMWSCGLGPLFAVESSHPTDVTIQTDPGEYGRPEGKRGRVGCGIVRVESDSANDVRIHDADGATLAEFRVEASPQSESSGQAQ